MNSRTEERASSPSLNRRSLPFMESRWVHGLRNQDWQMVLPTVQHRPTESPATIRRRFCLSSKKAHSQPKHSVLRTDFDGCVTAEWSGTRPTGYTQHHQEYGGVRRDPT